SLHDALPILPGVAQASRTAGPAMARMRRGRTPAWSQRWAVSRKGGRMRQVVITRRGGPEVLEVREAPDLKPAPGQVHTRRAHAEIGRAHVMARVGMYPDAPPL